MSSNILSFKEYMYKGDFIQNESCDGLKEAQQQLKKLKNGLGLKMLAQAVDSMEKGRPVVSDICKTIDGYYIMNSPNNIKEDTWMNKGSIESLLFNLKAKNGYVRSFIFKEESSEEIYLWIITKKITLEEKLQYMSLTDDNHINIIFFRETEECDMRQQLDDMKISYQEA